MEVLKVSSKSTPNSVAGAIAGVVKILVVWKYRLWEQAPRIRR